MLRGPANADAFRLPQRMGSGHRCLQLLRCLRKRLIISGTDALPSVLCRSCQVHKSHKQGATETAAGGGPTVDSRSTLPALPSAPLNSFSQTSTRMVSGKSVRSMSITARSDLRCCEYVHDGRYVSVMHHMP